MNIASINKNINFSLNVYINPFKIEPNLYKFASIILAIDQVKEACNESRLVSWLKSDKLNNTPTNVKDYQAVVFSILGLCHRNGLQIFRERTRVAKQYAKILAQYIPNEKGDINQGFNYFQLVSVIKEVFEKHIFREDDLFSCGLEILLEGKKFYAKVEAQKIFMFIVRGNLLGEGNFGKVFEIYEIASQQLLALKCATNFRDIKHINREISVLKNLHALAHFGDFDVTGLQDPPLAIFQLPELNGFLGRKYGIDLFEWANQEHSNEERITICKYVVKAFLNKNESGFWHGDIKLDNILISDNGVVIIDWDGSLPFLQASKNLERSHVSSAHCVSIIDLENLDLILNECEEFGLTNDLSQKFLDSAKSMELFSLAIVLFCILVKEQPFDMSWNDDYSDEFPSTKEGICQVGLNALMDKNYDEKIVKTIKQMLSHDPQNRCSLKQVVDFWETI